jgi:heme iron utilization protein
MNKTDQSNGATLPTEQPRIDPIRATDDDARALARDLMSSARVASLATLEAGTGFPFASLVSLATDLDGTPLILISRLSGHTQNLMTHPRASLLIARSGKGDPLAHPRITLMVTARVLDRESTEGRRARARFLKQQPKAKLYVDFPDFSFVALDVERASLNGGFARAFSLTRDDIIVPI